MPGKRPLFFVALLLVTVAIAAVAAGFWMRQMSYGPWAFTLSWSDMDSRLETQVIAATSVQLDIQPDRGYFEGVAEVLVANPGGNGGEVFLLLNPGLDLLAATCDGVALRVARNRERLRITLPMDITTGTLRLTYAGEMKATNGSTFVVDGEEVLLDKLQFWYPVDLKNFVTFEAVVAVPEAMEVVWSGSLKENEVRDGKRYVHWEESRPILAAGLAAGTFTRHSRVQGSIRCNIYGEGLDEDRVERYLTALGDSYNALNSRLGPDNYTQLNLVVSDSIDVTDHAGGPLILALPDEGLDGDALFASLAAQVARNWWGDTVSGRWFSTRPEAGEWLVSGLAEYNAWQALRSVKGRRAFLRHMETRICAPQIDVPMKTYNLGQRLRRGAGYDPTLVEIRGAYAAAVIASQAGTEAFDVACANFMAVHRYTTVSFGALLHEITMASEVPLDELVRVWFDRPGTFDYRISNVVQEGNRLHVTVANSGDIPSYVSMKLGVVTEGGYQVHEFAPGAQGDTVDLPLDGVLRRVVLDPEFELGDMRRANNMWPSTEWPTKLAAAPNGRIALLSQSEWGGEGGGHLALFTRMDKTPESTLNAGETAPQWFAWDGDGGQLAVCGEVTGIWRQRQWTPLDLDSSDTLGWYLQELMPWHTVLEGVVTGSKAGIASRRPRNGAINPETGDVAYIDADGHLVWWEASSSRTTLLRENVHLADALRWRAGESELIYFERDGNLVILSIEDDTRSVLLRRNYQVTRSAISGKGRYVAWVDPAGLLRAVEPGSGEPVYLSLPGEIVDFSWEGEEALIALVATIPRRLPMRYHAEYSLWRIPVSSWQGVRLPYDAAQFAQTPEETITRLAG